MAAPIRFLSGRQQQQKIGIEGSTENQKVLEVVGQVGIGTTIFSTSVELEVHGDQIITGILTVGNIDVTGVGGGGGEIEVENLNVTGFSTFGNTADFNGDIDVDGHTELDNLNVSGVSTFNGNVGFTTNIDVDGHTELDNVNVSGVSTFTGAADFNGDIDVDGHTELDNLNVSGVSTFVGVGTFLNDLYVSDNVYISGFLTATRLYSSVFGEFTGSSVSADSIVGLALSIAGLSTFTGAADFNGDIDVDGHTELDDVNVSGAITATTFSGNLTGNAGTATALETARNFEITGDVVASVISFDGTGNVSLAATIQPNSVELGTDTTGDYVESVSGTANEIQVTSGTGEGSTPTIGFVANPTIGGNVNIGQDLTVTRDVQIVRNLNVNGNITVGGTSATLFTETLKISDSDIVLGFRTDANGNDVSNDTTASHGGVAIASTEGTPLVSLVGAGETLPSTYKKIMWFKSGSFAGLGTDAWLSNYAVGIGSTQFPTGTRLAAGSVQFTENDLAVIRNINASGVVTASNGFVGNLTGIASTASNLTRSVIAGDGLTGGGELNADRTLNVGVGTGITINSDNVELRNSENLTGGTITKWDDGNGQLADSLVTETGTIVNVGSGITFFTSTGIISATAYFGSGGDLEDIIKSKLEGITTKFKPHDSSIATLGGLLTTAEVAIIDNTTVGFITAVGFGSTAQYYFNDVTAVGLTTDASVNTTGIITAGGFTASGGAFTGDGSGLTNLGGVSAGVTVSNNDATVGTASVLNFGEDIDVSPISAGVVTFSLNNNQNFTGIVTISSFEVSGVSTFTGVINANGGLDVTGHTELDNLNVSGVSTFQSDVTFTGLSHDMVWDKSDNTLEFADGARAAFGTGSDLIIQHNSGQSSISESNGNGLEIKSIQVTITPNGSAEKMAEFNANSSVDLYYNDSKKFETTGYGVTVFGTTQTQQLNVSGVSTFTGAADFNGDIDVDGHTELDNLNVSGVSTLTNVEIGASLYDSNNSTGSAGQLLSSVGSGISWTNTTTTASGQNILSVPSSDTYNLTSSDIVSGVATAGFVSSSVVMTGTGSVGIGTTNPQAKLHVVDEFILSTAGAASTQRISERAYATDNGTLSWEGSAGQLFSISNNLTSGSIFSVNDVSGIPSIDVDADGTIQLAPFGVTEKVGIGTTNPTSKLHVVGNTELDNLNVTGVSTFTGAADFNGSIDVDGHTELDNLNVTGVSTFQSHVHLGDDDELRFGANNDFKIYHDPDDARIENTNGDIKFKNTGSYFFFDENGGETLASFINDGAVNLFYNGGKKFETTGYGATVFGTLQSQQLNVSGVSTFQNDVSIGVGGTTAFFDVSTGNIGIGSIQPLVALDVAGVIREELHTPTMPVGLNDDIGVNWSKIEMGSGLEFIFALVYCGNGIVLAGSGSGANDGDVYRSTDFGLTFTKIEMGADLEFILSLVYCGNGIVLAGTGAGANDGDVYRSTDFGLTFTKIEMGADLEQIRSLVYCGNGIVLAGSGSGGGDGDIYRSTDFGLTFTKIEMGSSLEFIFALVYCGNGIVLAGSGSGGNDGDVYRSTDFGLTFTKIEMGSSLEEINALVYCGNGIVLAGSGSGTGDGDIYRSTDFGLTFTKIEMGAGLEIIVSLVYCGNGIVLAGSGSGTGDGDIYKSTDFGLTFTKIEMGSGLESIYSLVYCGNGIVLAGSGFGTGDGDIYRSDVGFSQASTIQGIYHEHLTGNIGIGTTNPTEKLDVNGNIRVRGSLYDSNNSAGNAGVILSSTGAGVSWTNSTTTASGQSILEASASIPYYISASPITSGVSTAGFVESDIVIKNGNIGIGTTVPTTALHVIGEVTATDYNSTSDAKLKTNVQVIEDPLEKVLQIDGVSFNWIENNKPSMGVIADNIQEILPELVSNSDPKTVNYNGLIGLLIECVKQQQVEIEGLKRKIG